MKVALVYLNNFEYVGMGPGYIAAAAMRAGHEVDFFDTFCTEHRAIVEALQSGQHAILLLSAATLAYPEAMELAAEVKQALPSLPILLGGLHATIVQGVVLDECPAIDYICIGEGEEFIVEFLDALSSSLQDKLVVNIANLGYRMAEGTEEEVIRVNRVRPSTDLDSLPPFPYGLFASPAVVQPHPFPGFCYVYATRGCPYNCSYCCNGCYLKLYGRQYLRTRDVSQVIAELLRLKREHPVEFFYFGDEMILFDEEYVTDLFRRVHDEVRLPYGCMARVERITPSIVKLLAATGCRYVGMGVECGDETFRREFLNRHMSNQQIIAAFRALRAVPGITLAAYNMTGYPVPYNSRLDRATKRLIKQIGPDFAQTNIFYPFPGTKLHDYCMEHDLIDPERARGLTSVNIKSHSILRQERLQPAT